MRRVLGIGRWTPRGRRMGCRKGESNAKPKAGRFRCADCGAVVKKKKDACEPQKIDKR